MLPGKRSRDREPSRAVRVSPRRVIQSHATPISPVSALLWLQVDVNGNEETIEISVWTAKREQQQCSPLILIELGEKWSIEVTYSTIRNAKAIRVEWFKVGVGVPVYTAVLCTNKTFMKSHSKRNQLNPGNEYTRGSYYSSNLKWGHRFTICLRD